MTDPDFPNRPQHPDFWWLSDHVLAMDDASEDQPGFSVGDALAGLPIDPTSLTYFAQNRAMLAVNLATATSDLPNLPMTNRLRLIVTSLVAGAYIDAFVLGAAYGRKLAEEGR